MSTQLPALSRDEFARRLAPSAAVSLPPAAVDALFSHYGELRRWSPRLSLIGAGEADQVVDRHYGEALAALPLIPATARTLIDVGSGAGFPGVVLAAARPDLAVTLVEPRERRWAFLEAACRRAALPVSCLWARLDLLLPKELPDPIDVVTIRALKLPTTTLDALVPRLSPSGRLLFWIGEATPELPPTLTPSRSLPLPGTHSRRILEVLPTD